MCVYFYNAFIHLLFSCLTFLFEQPTEGTMLEDAYVGVYDLERVTFHFRAITENIEANGNSFLFLDFQLCA